MPLTEQFIKDAGCFLDRHPDAPISKLDYILEVLNEEEFTENSEAKNLRERVLKIKEDRKPQIEKDVLSYFG